MDENKTFTEEFEIGNDANTTMDSALRSILEGKDIEFELHDEPFVIGGMRIQKVTFIGSADAIRWLVTEFYATGDMLFDEEHIYSKIF